MTRPEFEPSTMESNCNDVPCSIRDTLAEGLLHNRDLEVQVCGDTSMAVSLLGVLTT